MKGRRALPTAEALTGQKPRQRLHQLLSSSYTSLSLIASQSKEKKSFFRKKLQAIEQKSIFALDFV